MFDLDAAVTRWRDGLESMAPDARDELEDHLRSATEELQARGLAQDEAFLVAARRLGTTADLDVEFAKVPSAFAGRRMRWMLTGALAAIALPIVARLTARAAGAAGVAAGVDDVLLPWITFAAGALVFVLTVRGLLGVGGRAPHALVRAIEGREHATKRTRVLFASGAAALLIAFLAANTALSVGMARLATPTAFGHVVVGARVLQQVMTIALVAGAALLLYSDRGSKRPSHLPTTNS